MKRIYLIVTTISLAANSFAQSDSAAEATQVETSAAKSTLTLGASYSNNASYYGQRAIESMPYVLAMASWRHHSGFYLTGAGYKLLKDSGGVVSASSLGAGVSFKPGKNVTADVSYSHTFYPAGSPFLQAANANSASASLSLEKWLTTTANVDYAFGKTQDLFASLSASKFISLGSLFNSSDLLSITPSAEVVGGTRHFYETYITEKRLRDSLAGIPLSPLLGDSGGGETVTTTKAKTSFDLVSYNFRLPLAYNRAAYQVEIAYQLSVLSTKAAYASQKTNSFFSAAFYYQF
jgi:hypothetical protein